MEFSASDAVDRVRADLIAVHRSGDAAAAEQARAGALATLERLDAVVADAVRARGRIASLREFVFRLDDDTEGTMRRLDRADDVSATSSGSSSSKGERSGAEFPAGADGGPSVEEMRAARKR